MATSKSTDKLAVIMDTVKGFTENEDIKEMKCEVTWKTLELDDGNGGCSTSLPVPDISISFKR